MIGNPPYIRIQTMKEWAPLEVEFYKTAFAAAGKGNYDIYVVFVEKGLSLLNAKGRLGFILPHKFFNAQYGEPLRALLAKGKHLAEIVHFGDAQVFAGATTYTCLLFLDKAVPASCRFTKVAGSGGLATDRRGDPRRHSREADHRRRVELHRRPRRRPFRKTPPDAGEAGRRDIPNLPGDQNQRRQDLYC